MSDESIKLQFSDLDDFILWAKKESLNLTLRSIGRNFFDDPEFYKDKWELPDEEDLPEEIVLDESVEYIEEDDKCYVILSPNAEKVLCALSNILLYKMLSRLVDDGVLELCWSKDAENFVWRVKE